MLTVIPAQAGIFLGNIPQRMKGSDAHRMTDKTAYKVLTQAQFAALQNGSFEGAPVDLADGYIHLSTAAQLTETVAKYFAGQNGIIIAAVDLAALGETIRWEPSRNGALFPHLYGRLSLENVTSHCPLAYAPDGSVRLP